MKHKLLTALFAVAIATLACSMTLADGFTPAQVGSIEQGMTVKQVKKILGDPALRDIDGPEEVWTFRNTEKNDGTVEEIRIWFLDGKVLRMKCREQAGGRQPDRYPRRDFRRGFRHHCADSCYVAGDSCCHDHPYPYHRHGRRHWRGGCCR